MPLVYADNAAMGAGDVVDVLFGDLQPYAERRLRRDKQGERRASIWMRNCRRMHDGRRA